MTAVPGMPTLIRSLTEPRGRRGHVEREGAIHQRQQTREHQTTGSSCLGSSCLQAPALPATGRLVVVKDFRRKHWQAKHWPGAFQILLTTHTAVKGGRTSNLDPRQPLQKGTITCRVTNH
ncbi:hypothetical protein L3Q82_023162 [Scortum barcoo]|uniref:Uncharacterized protein n=1 Tax=Scortum barcoo TaxID=214431 RepID=A0ACB8WZH3_9TELE|nr:hypothetical protein L3Q82_023162 [Scortum barcoo]